MFDIGTCKLRTRHYLITKYNNFFELLVDFLTNFDTPKRKLHNPTDTKLHFWTFQCHFQYHSNFTLNQYIYLMILIYVLPPGQWACRPAYQASTMACRKTARRAGTKKRAQRATSNVFAMFDQDQIQEFKEAFNMIDQNRDGFIDHDDLKDMLASLGKVMNNR